MADESHLRLVKRGGEAIERWRKRGHKTAVLDLEGADLSGIDLTAADLSNADLTGAQLREAILDCAVLRDAGLQKADLTGASVEGADLQWAKIGNATLAGADFSGSDLSYADLSGATLDSADFTNARLKETDFSGSEMTLARFWVSRFNMTLFSNATFANTVIYECDLRGIIGLETVNHRGPSLIGVETLYKSAGQIPAAFLRGCGVPDSLIAYVHSLNSKALTSTHVSSRIQKLTTYLANGSTTIYRPREFGAGVGAKMQNGEVRYCEKSMRASGSTTSLW
jgi:uncharacterized protein YjbI with pentapeptide repeats